MERDRGLGTPLRVVDGGDARPGLDSCLRALRTGDVLVVWTLDRLGRTLAHLPGSKPVSPRPKGEAERLAVRRLAAMKYRLAGASYRMIAEKLTEDRANAYADANGVSVERAMKKIPHVSKRTAWDDVTAEMEDLRRETEVQRADLMALENARLDQLFSKSLSLSRRAACRLVAWRC